jgi:hypothetical protein
MREGNIYIHFIEEDGDQVYSKELVCAVPRAGDEVRFGGPNNEQVFTVTRIVWVYDEPGSPYHRVNVGIELAV